MSADPETGAADDLDALQDGDLIVVMDAVQLARDWQLHSVEALRGALERQGHDPDQIRRALLFWARYEQDKTPAARAA